MKRIALALLILACCASPAIAQGTVFLVRHAERADAGQQGGGMMAKDPSLSPAGRARAALLATILKDARITRIFATEFKRTQQTAAPLAKVLGVTVTVVPAADVAALVTAVAGEAGNVLIVGHSNTVPEVIQKLGVSQAVTIGDADYDNLFIVTKGATPALLRLHMPVAR